MQVLKRLILYIFIAALALCIGGGIYLLQSSFFEKDEEIITTPSATVLPTEEPTPEPTAEPVAQMYITTDVVNLREAPTTESAVVMKVPKDTIVQLYYMDNEWAFVKYADKNVYVSVEYITEYIQP